MWKAAVDLAKLQQNEREVVVVDGKKILFIWHDEQVHAIQSQCPHFKYPLAKGKITEECAIVCPLHKSEFNLSTGEVKCWSPWPAVVGNFLGKIVKPKNLTIFPTKIENGKIHVNIS